MDTSRATFRRFAVTLLTLTTLAASSATTHADQDCFTIRGRQLSAHAGPAAVSGSMTAIVQHGSWDTRPMVRIVLFGPFGAVEVGSWSPTRFIEDIALDVATAFVSADHGIFALDLRVPSQPQFLDFIDLVDAQHIVLDHQKIYIATTGVGGTGWFDIIDVADPTDLRQMGQLAWTGGDPEKNAIDAAGETVVIADDGGLLILDVGDPYNPVEAGRWDGEAVHDAALVGSYAVVTSEPADPPINPKVTVLDLSNPASPAPVGQWLAPSTVLSLAEYGGDVLAGTESDGLYLVDLDDPAHPTVLDHWDELGLEVTALSTAWPTITASSSDFGLTILGLTPECLPPRMFSGRLDP
ncbi:MAG: hypothetical protein V2I67_14910 [Thermoanaerobaculales bacterium]|nr:hypothetical protein [Thermoanaerobaculales bacterium]